MIGKTLDRYQILKEIGRGAMGQVYLARDTRLSRNVALKMLPPGLVKDHGRRRRFDRESLALAALNHPNIVTIHSVEEVDGQPFLVMEWIQGRPLTDLLAAGKLNAERWMEIAVTLAGAVAEAHRAGIVHRDLKPANIMVREDGMIKVVDFGISLIEQATLVDGDTPLPTVLSERLTAEGIAVGTLPYMSPEQLQGRPVDTRSDIFSLGVILYEMAAGQYPFFGETQAALAAAILRDVPLPPTRLNPGLPAEVDRIVERCIAKPPGARYPTGEELHADLLAARRDREHTLLTGSRLAGPPTLPEVPPPALPGLSSTQGGTTAVAVLPLRNLSGDPGQDYFSEGMTEVMIANLAKVRALRVISRASVMRYQTSRPELPEIARALGVHYIIEGSVLRSGDELLIIMALVDPLSGGALWGDTYRGGLREVFTLQQQAAQEVTRAIKGELSVTDDSRLGDFHEVAPDVYEAYLKARYLLNKRTPDAVREALELLDGALASDPDYALGWATRAECYLYLTADLMHVIPMSEGLPMAREAAQRALRLNPNLSEAHVVLGFIHLQSWEWDEVEKEFLRALELNPSNADAYQKYTLFLTAQGRHDEALKAIYKARKLDPLSLPLRFGVISNCLLAGQYREAAEGARAAIGLQPELWLGHYFLGSAFYFEGRYAEADAELRQAVDLSRRMPVALAALARNAVRSGNAEEAQRIVEELEEAFVHAFVPPTTIAIPLAALGELDRALDWLEKGVEAQDHGLLLVGVNPHFQELHGHPRFESILGRVGLRKAA
ncbi:MAG: protein kinase domain-containing protein [Thermoanaerobaculia bacterium]